MSNLKTYRVLLREEIDYVIEIEAENDESAGDLAEDLWFQSDNRMDDFKGSSSGIEVWAVEEV